MWWWIGASTAGGALTGALENLGLQFAATLILQGFIVGFAQWPALRSRVPRALWWIPATGVGMVAGWLIWMQRPQLLVDLPIWLMDNVGLWEVFWLHAFTMGWVMLVAGLLQWWVLRSVPGAAWWLPLSLLAGLLMGATAAYVSYLYTFSGLNMTLPPALPGALSMGLGWSVYAVLTGPYLMRDRPATSE